MDEYQEIVQKSEDLQRDIDTSKQILRQTDYRLLKAFEHILQADSLDELMIRIQYAREMCQDSLATRQNCRNKINESEAEQMQLF